MHLRAMILGGIACLLLPGCAALQKRKPDDLKVTRAVLYQNGIGYFERQGKVKGQQIKLRILPQQITDVLKSLTVVDLGSGRAINVALPVEKTRSRRMSALPPQVRRGGGIMAIARAFRGARATVRSRGSSGTGRILGVESVAQSGEWRLTILKDNGTLQSFDLKAVRSMQIKDRTLEVGLRKALDVALDSGSWKPVELTVHLTGETPHNLLVSYVVEMPTWKPAYRVVLTSGKTDGLLQGWAVVDNVSGEDWNKVSLSLTAGTPLTFTYDLYSPRYVRRPDLSPQQESWAEAPPPPTSGAAPADEEAESDSDMDDAIASKEESRKPDRSGPRKKSKRRYRRGRGGRGGGLSSRRAPAARRRPPRRPAPRPRLTSALLEKSFSALVTGSRVGSLFRYDIEEPVTIRDRQSALVSLLNKKVPAEDVLLFRMETSRTNPYRAVRLTNTTGYILEGGPVAIYKDGDFVGEAVGGKVEAKTSTFIPYSLDGRVLITLNDRMENQGARLLKIVGGQFHLEVKRVSIHKYTVYNRSGKEATLYIQRRHRTGWKIVQPNKGVLIEKHYVFIPVKVAAKGKTEIEVKEETPVRRWSGFDSKLGRDAIKLYINDPAADQKIAASLKEAYSLHEQIYSLRRKINKARRDKRLWTTRMSQVRANIRVLGKSKLNARLALQLTRKLKVLSGKLDKVTGEMVALDTKRAALKDRLTVLLRSITLTVKKK